MTQKNFAKGLLLAAALFALPVTTALASFGTNPVSLSVVYPSLIVNLNNLNFGASYLAVNKTNSTATAIVSPAIVLTNPPTPPGTARLIPVDASGVNKLRVNIMGGIPNTTLSLSIMDDTALTPYITLIGTTTPSDAKFKIDGWTFAVQPGGGSLTGFNPATAAGTITLNGTGDIDIWFGATLSTVPSALSYSSQDYSGTLRVTVSY